MKEKWIGGNWMNRYKVPLASSQSFLEEIKRCLYLLPAWERVLLEGRERPKVVGRPHLNGPWLHAICSIFWQRHMEDQTAFLSMKKKTQISCHQSQSNNVVIDCLTAVLYGRLRVEPFKNRLAKEPGTGRRSVHALLLTDNIRRHLITNICNNGLFGVFARRSSVKYALGIVHVYDHLRNNAVLRPYMQRQQAQGGKQGHFGGVGDKRVWMNRRIVGDWADEAGAKERNGSLQVWLRYASYEGENGRPSKLK